MPSFPSIYGYEKLLDPIGENAEIGQIVIFPGSSHLEAAQLDEIPINGIYRISEFTDSEVVLDDGSGTTLSVSLNEAQQYMCLTTDWTEWEEEKELNALHERQQASKETKQKIDLLEKEIKTLQKTLLLITGHPESDIFD